ncbi:MAG: ABC transporter ATP-binding protein [Fervidicoccaceae archaeon]
MRSAIEAESLWKIYSRGRRPVEALRGITFNIESGSITALLGRNGAGKTTFLRIAATQLLPTRGTVRVLGHDVVDEVWRVRELIAMVPQDARPLGFPSPREYVKAVQVMRGESFAEAEKRAREVLEEMEVPRSLWNRSIWSLSGGMIRRVLLAAVLASDAPVLFLDEPSVGLDPLSRRRLWSKITKLKEGGRTVVLTTHYVEEAEALSDKVVMIHKGSLLAEGRPLDLVSSLGRKYKVEVRSKCDVEALKSWGEVLGSEPPIVVYVNGAADAAELVEELSSRGCAASMSPVTLEDFFLLSTRS